MKTYASRPKPESAIRKYRPRGKVQVPKLSSDRNEVLSAKLAMVRLVQARGLSTIASNMSDRVMPVAANPSSASAERTH